jgi:hypothetical protein
MSYKKEGIVMLKHREVQEITIPDFVLEWEAPLLIQVQRPDFALIAHSEFDIAGLINKVAEAFGEDVPGSSAGDGGTAHKDFEYYRTDLLKRTLVSPTYDVIERINPLTEFQRAVIINWIFKDIGELIDIILNKNVAWSMVIQCGKFRKSPHEILDPHNEYCGLYHIYFDRAMIEYYLRIENDQKPIDLDTSGSQLTLMQSLGVQRAKNSVVQDEKKPAGLADMSNTAEVLKNMMNKSN